MRQEEVAVQCLVRLLLRRVEVVVGRGGRGCDRLCGRSQCNENSRGWASTSPVFRAIRACARSLEQFGYCRDASVRSPQQRFVCSFPRYCLPSLESQLFWMTTTTNSVFHHRSRGVFGPPMTRKKKRRNERRMMVLGVMGASTKKTRAFEEMEV